MTPPKFKQYTLLGGLSLFISAPYWGVVSKLEKLPHSTTSTSTCFRPLIGEMFLNVFAYL